MTCPANPHSNTRRQPFTRQTHVPPRHPAPTSILTPPDSSIVFGRGLASPATYINSSLPLFARACPWAYRPSADLRIQSIPAEPKHFLRRELSAPSIYHDNLSGRLVARHRQVRPVTPRQPSPLYPQTALPAPARKTSPDYPPDLSATSRSAVAYCSGRKLQTPPARYSLADLLTGRHCYTGLSPPGPEHYLRIDTRWPAAGDKLSRVPSESGRISSTAVIRKGPLQVIVAKLPESTPAASTCRDSDSRPHYAFIPTAFLSVPALHWQSSARISTESARNSSDPDSLSPQLQQTQAIGVITITSGFLAMGLITFNATFVVFLPSRPPDSNHQSEPSASPDDVSPAYCGRCSKLVIFQRQFPPLNRKLLRINRHHAITNQPRKPHLQNILFRVTVSSGRSLPLRLILSRVRINRQLNLTRQLTRLGRLPDCPFALCPFGPSLPSSLPSYIYKRNHG